MSERRGRERETGRGSRNGGDRTGGAEGGDREEKEWEDGRQGKAADGDIHLAREESTKIGLSLPRKL